VRRWRLLAGYLLLAGFAAVQQWSLRRPADPYTHYNNYIIFRQAFEHLVRGDDLYVQYLVEHWDYFRYSPSFAAAFGLFAWMPDLPGLLIWNTLNASMLLLALWSVTAARFRDERVRAAAAWLVAIEMMTALQNAQSNVLIAGLLILAFTLLERGRLRLAALAIVAAAFIKPFALAGLTLGLFYPRKQSFVAWSALWIVAIAALPLLIVTPLQLVRVYASWWRLLDMDFAGSDGLSVMGWLTSWFRLTPPKTFVDLAGVALFCWPLLLGVTMVERATAPLYRLLMLANVLIWVVIFNHKAESSTYIIAMGGIALWYFGQAKSRGNFMLLMVAFVFTCLSPTDLFPRAWGERFFDPYKIKAVPCILIWLKITHELVTWNVGTTPVPSLAADRRQASGYN
jgi:hypothetical protein